MRIVMWTSLLLLSGCPTATRPTCMHIESVCEASSASGSTECEQMSELGMWTEAQCQANEARCLGICAPSTDAGIDGSAP